MSVQYDNVQKQWNTKQGYKYQYGLIHPNS